MTKRMIRFGSLLVAAILITTACQGQSAPEAAKPAVPKKLSIEEVLGKSADAAQEAKGLTYKIEGDQHITIEADGESEQIDQKTSMDMKMTNDPQAVHFTGSVEGGGQSQKLEAYQIGNEIYQTGDGSTWLKSEGADLKQAAGGQAENPSKAMKQLDELISKLRGEQKNEAFNMEESGGNYILTLNLSKAPQNVRDVFMKQLTGAMIPQFKQAGIPVQEDDIKVERLEQVYTIDKKSFKQEQMHQTMHLEIPVNDGTTSGTIRADQTLSNTLSGEFNGTIEVPQDVKNNAQEATVQ